MSGIANMAYLNAAANYKPETSTFRTQFKSELSQLVNAMPIQDQKSDYGGIINPPVFNSCAIKKK
ncbi:MAG: hypothetical protein KFF73_14305 [Cyclobacteriaceae bacterium]|nr:hypothetical protein [Cyclobacteriaceae bacterium]